MPVTRRFLLVILLVALVGAACSSVPTVGDPDSGPPVSSDAADTSGPAPETTTTTSDEVDSSNGTTTTTEREGINSPELEAAIAELVEITEDIRELTFKEPPTVVFVTEAELAERVRDLIEEDLDPEELAWTQATLYLIGVLEPGRDLRQLYLDLYSGVVAGYYDPEEGELVVPVTNGELTASQKVTLVHELTHALTDQYFDFGSIGEELDDAQEYEASYALRGVVEGDASLTETLYFQSLSSGEQRDVINSSGGDPDALAGVPRYIQELLFFPYTTGAQFAVDLWQSGGFDAIDDAYVDRPTTTEQIIDPDAFREGEDGLVVDLTDAELEGYELVEASIWGELGFDALLGQTLSAGQADRAADGWGGDAYQVYFNGEQAVFVLSYIGDEERDAVELADALVDHTNAAVGDESYRFIRQDGDMVIWILADDPAAGAAVRTALAP